MTGKIDKDGPENPEHINVHEERDLRYWTQKWKVTPDELKKAVHKVGPFPGAVHRELTRQA